MKTTVKHFVNYLSMATLTAVIVSSCGNATQQSGDQSQQGNETQTVPSLSQVWITDSSFTGSESTLYDSERNIVYVTCGNTDASAKDNDGFISLLNPDGSVKELKWITGFNAPKGMAILEGKLYVTDIDEIKIIDIESASIEQTIPVEGAIFLNDLATDGSTVYFSDTRAGIIYSLTQDGEVKSIVNNAENVNGLECHNGNLYTLDKEGLKQYNTSDFTHTLLNTEVTGGDGLVILNDSTFIASKWAGEIYFIKGKETTLMIDTKDEKSNTADIGFIEDEDLVLVPTFLKNEVAAYKLTR